METGVTSAVMLAVGAVLLCLLIRIFIKPLRLMVKLAANSAIGSLLLVLFNYMGGIFGINLGVNLYSALICGALGLPGFLLLLAGKLFIT